MPKKCVFPKGLGLLEGEKEVFGWVRQGQYIQFHQNVQFNVKQIVNVKKNIRIKPSSIYDSKRIQNFWSPKTLIDSKNWSPVHNPSEQNSHLLIILNAFRISDPHHLTGQKRLSVHGSKSIANFW